MYKKSIEDTSERVGAWLESYEGRSRRMVREILGEMSGHRQRAMMREDEAWLKAYEGRSWAWLEG